MNIRPRSTFLRCLLAGFAMLFLCFAVYVGFGWALWSRQAWVFSTGLGTERLNYLALAYARALGGIFSADSDGDGLSDGFEAYLQSDPHDPTKCPQLNLYTAIATSDPGDLGFAAPPIVVLQPGERRLIRAQIRSWGERATFGPNARILVFLDGWGPGLICLPGGTPSIEPLQVPVTTDGGMEFELSIPPDAPVTDPIRWSTVYLNSSNSDNVFAQVEYVCQRRGPAIPCRVERLPGPGGWSRINVTRPPTLPSGPLLIEAGGESGDQWFVMRLLQPEDSSATLFYRLDNFDLSVRGPVQFRIVPVTATAPAK